MQSSLSWAPAVEQWLLPVAQLAGPVYPWVSGSHILFIGLLCSIFLLDLSLLGIFKPVNIAALARPTIRLAAIGLAGAMFTGLLLFSVQPVEYLGNTLFGIKLLIIATGLVNIIAVRQLPEWQRILTGEPPTVRVQFIAAISGLVWISVIFAGRWIAYTQ